jgi:VIT1/CCC1 family predicted Fe2+/Mn2+ transporter
MIKESFRTGFSFGLTSGIITTLGLMVGLHSGTHSKLAVIGGILTIAVADALSDALGIHISEESEAKHTAKEVWEATFATLLAKFFFATIFIFPVLIFNDLNSAIILSVIFGLILLGILSFYIAKNQNLNPWRAVFEHLIVALLVIIFAHFIGDLISAKFE